MSGSTVVARLGDACVRALGVVLLASVPTGLRTAVAGGSFFDGLLIGAAVLLPLDAAALVLARQAGRGFRQLAGDPAHESRSFEAARGAVLGIALWTGIALPLLIALAAVLKATTHHRGLAGGTFGVLGLAILVGAAILARRLVLVGRGLVARGVPAWVIAAIGAAVGTLPLLAMASPLGHRGEDPASAVRAAILDGAIVLIATALAASLDLRPALARFSARFGLALAVVVFLGAGVRIETSHPSGRAFKAGGGLASTMLGALESWTDRDGDGHGAYFGGDDCDEGDPSRHPGAVEIPGDGIDQDCDGIDPPAARPEPTAEAKPAADADVLGPVADQLGIKRGTKPDVILVTLDSVRADHCSTYGYAKETTPSLTALAAHGVLFAHAYAAGGDTENATAPLVSGNALADTPHDKHAWPAILAEVDTVAERMKRAGYRTAAVPSFTWLREDKGFAQGFDYFQPVFKLAHPEREVTGGFALKAATDVVKEASAEKDVHPLFLWVHLFDAHERFNRHKGIDFGKDRTGLYDGEVAYTDKILGELITAISAARAGRTVVWLVHGANGISLGEHERGSKGAGVYEEEVAIPLVISKSAADAKPMKADQVVSVLDIAPTIVDAGGAERASLAGQSLLRGFDKHPIFFRSAKAAGLIHWPLKLIVEEGRRPKTFLFDLSVDPSERNDLSGDRASDTERLAGEMRERSPKK